MTLSELTDEAAVKAAIKECDELGRDAFLRQYGFRPARKYFLKYKNKLYDSKAIAGVAHGVQFPEQGPLTSDSFSGGANTVYRKLQSLRFDVIRIGPDQRPPKQWAFCANPTRYWIREAVKNLEIDYWHVRRSNVRAGDRAIIWQTRDSEGHRGIVAFADILGDPAPRTDERNPYWINPEDRLTTLLRVPVSYSVPADLPLWVDDTEIGTFLKSLSVARAGGGTVFKLTPEQWITLVERVPYKETSIVEVETREQLRHRSSTRDGQGFGLSIAERKAVEDYAMSIAQEHFKKAWDSVMDVSANCSYDLLCQKENDELRVEVKGTTTAGEQIVLTRNEVIEAEKPGYTLFIVSDVVLDRSDLKKPAASGGTARLFSPWTPTPETLKAISYMCDIDITHGYLIEMKGD